MSNLILFPGPAQPTLVGRILSLNPERVKKFSCGGFFLNPRNPYSVVTEEAQLEPIRAAIEDGRLLDITEEFHAHRVANKPLKVAGSELGGSEDLGDTGKKAFLFRDASGDLKAACTDDPDLQAQLTEQALTNKRIVLPPGMDDPDKYLIRLEPLPEMSAPLVISVLPSDHAAGVVLGMPITVIFDQAIDQTTIGDDTFSLLGPGQTALIVDERIVVDPEPQTGREYVPGTFTFPATDRFVFTPSRSLRPGVKYTILLAGSDSSLANVPKNLGGEPLEGTLQVSFTTSDLNLTTPPPQMPLPSAEPALLPEEIRVIPRPLTGNDLSQTVTLHLPGVIDPTSIDAAYTSSQTAPDSNPFNDILVSVDAMMDDPLVKLPPNLQFSARVVGNKIEVSVAGLP